MRTSLKGMALCAIVAAAIGCGSGGGGGAAAPAASGPTSTTSASSVEYKPAGVLAGLPVSPSTDLKPYARLVMASNYGHREDPFKLTSEENAYDKEQESNRIFASEGFANEYTPQPEETKEVPAEEPQPYRRLAGIIVGDSVLAIIDMGDGQARTIIRPGEHIPNTEWTVVSIDEDKAILHRDGNVGPHTISVRLESPPAGFGGAGFGGAGAGQGANQGRPPGAPGGPGGLGGPGGRRGGRGAPGAAAPSAG